MKLNCKQCITLPICLNILKEDLIKHQANINYYKYTIRVYRLRDKCSIMADHISTNSFILLKRLLIDILELDNIESDIYVSYLKY